MNTQIQESYQSMFRETLEKVLMDLDMCFESNDLLGVVFLLESLKFLMIDAVKKLEHIGGKLN